MKSLGHRFSILNFILVLGFFAALLAHAYVGLFTRYWYDDFCTAAILRDRGFLDFQRFWYVTWSGRFSFHLFVSLAELIGPRTVSFLTALALTLWLAAATWAIHQIFLTIRFPCPRISALVMGLTVVFLTIHSTPDVVQSLYWQTGMLTYLAPLILLTMYIGGFLLVLRKQPGRHAFWPLSVLSALITFVAGGLSETYSLLQVAGFSVLLAATVAYFPTPFKRLGLSLAATGLFGAIIAFSIVVVAPGNKNRLAAYPQKPPATSLVKSTTSYTMYFIERHTRRSRATALLSLILPAWLVLSVRLFRAENSDSPFGREVGTRTIMKVIGLSSIAALFLIAICFLPGYVVSSEGLPLRAQVVPQFLLIAFMMCSGFLLTLASLNSIHFDARLRPFSLTTISLVVVVLITLVPVRAAWKTFALGRTARTYATNWDEIEREIREARSNGATGLILPKINANNWELGFGRIDMQPGLDPTDGPNRCLAQYYHLESVRAE